MRSKYIIGNWKMNMLSSDTLAFLDEFTKQYDYEKTGVEVGLALQACLIYPVLVETEETNLLIGAQNCCNHLNGAYTGEISPALLADIGTHFCIIGHSERRQYYNESDEAVNQKAILLQGLNIEAVICVGETLEEFEANKTKEVIERQVEICCKDLDISKCTIAYEPVWAIGTGKSATAKIAQDVCHIIREKLRMMYGNDADDVTIQYGGSVNANNIKELMSQDDIDGALVGGASLKVDEFIKLVEYAK